MPTVVGVKLRFSPKTLHFDPADAEPAKGDHVVVETERGREVGEVVEASHDMPGAKLKLAPKPIVRVADDSDIEQMGELHAAEKEAMPVFRELINKHELDMKPVDVEYLFEGGKIIFYFSAEERVDFRELVRDLASRFKARIDMRQVGVRDEARMVGGIGHCGQVLCCERFAGDFQPVSIRMAKEQDLPLNPLKISGLCGRLMCCLRYEFDAYKEFKSRAPKRGAMIDTPVGDAKVVEVNTPKETATLRMPDGKNLKMPVSCMECKEGSKRPCQVSREALEAAGAPAALLEAPLSEASAEGSEKPEPRRGRPREGSRSKPRGEKPREGGKSEQSDKPSQGGESQESDRSKQGEKPKQSGKPRQGGKSRRGGKPKQGEQPKQGGQPKGDDTKKKDGQQGGTGSAASTSSSGRRRRRRHRPPEGAEGSPSTKDGQ